MLGENGCYSAGFTPEFAGSATTNVARSGGVAEWFRQGPAKPCTPVRFRSPPQPDLCRRVPGQALFFVDPAVSSVVPGRPPETPGSRLARASHAPRGSHEEVPLGYVEKQRGKYRARYRDPSGRITSKTFVRKAD